jgi:cytochrome P450
MRGLISAELEMRRATEFTDRDPDLLDMLLGARDESGSTLGDEEIQDQVLMLMITAGDAAAVASAWALYRAAKHPEVQDLLRIEHGALGTDPNPLYLAEQPFLTATCHEILRLHTVLPTVSGRRLRVPCDVLGYRPEAGVMLAPCQYLVHRQPSIFEQPLAFRPERFLGRSYAPHEYFPFGGGPRSCLGWSLAPLTVKLLLTTVLSQFRLASPTPDPPRVVRYGTLLAPEEDLALVVSVLH